MIVCNQMQVYSEDRIGCSSTYITFLRQQRCGAGDELQLQVRSGLGQIQRRGVNTKWCFFYGAYV